VSESSRILQNSQKYKKRNNKKDRISLEERRCRSSKGKGKPRAYVRAKIIYSSLNRLDRIDDIYGLKETLKIKHA